MIDFLEKGRKGMASTFLVRLKIGSRLSIPSLSEVLDYYTKKMGMVNQTPAPNNGGTPQQQMQTPPPSNGQ